MSGITGKENVVKGMNASENKSGDIYDKGKCAYALGWDFAVHGIHPPDIAGSDPNFMGGYREGQDRRIHIKADRFSRKWLTLRANAWARDRAFDEGVTPEYLRHIDARRCPITGVTLTHGTMTGSDWSIDRINNDGGYAIGNLVVVSTDANIAKSNFGFSDIVEIIRMDREIDGLTTYQWVRWLLVRSMVEVIGDKSDPDNMAIGYSLAPAVMIPPPGVPANPSVSLQIEIAMRAIGGDSKSIQKILSCVSRPVRDEITEMVRFAAKKLKGLHTRNPLDVWLNQRLFGSFIDTFSNMPEEDLIGIASTPRGRMKPLHGFSEDAFSLSRNGYAVDKVKTRPSPSAA